MRNARAIFVGLAVFAPGVALAAQPVSVSGGWARATLPHQNEGVAYLTLQSPAGDMLTTIDSPEAGMVMLHQSKTTNGVAEMDDMENLALPAGQTIALTPGGMHLMLMEVKHALKPGDTLHLSLHFDKAGTQTVAVPVMPVGAIGPGN
jgi:periplasmic copper chaperone A